MEPALGSSGSAPEPSAGLTTVDEKKKVNKWSLLKLRKWNSFMKSPYLLEIESFYLV